MSVYVDNSQNKFGRMVMCHMIADTLDELHLMAAKVGMRREWFQDIPNHPHYDLSKSKRALAISYGAVEIDGRELVAIIRKQRSIENERENKKDEG